MLQCFSFLLLPGLSMQYTDKENAAYVVGFAKAVKWHNFAAIVLDFELYIFCYRKSSYK